MRGGTQMASGQRRSASRMGMAERTPIAPHGIAGRGDHAAAARAADDQGLTFELRAILFFHGRIEGVHVDMQYRPHVIPR